MGTPSVTIVMDGPEVICRIYRQMDGGPEWHGVELARLCDVTIVNGFGLGAERQANGMSCLAAQIVAGLKKRIGGIYLLPPSEDSWPTPFIYVVRGEVGEKPTIECTDVFAGSPDDWLAKYRSAA